MKKQLKLCVVVGTRPEAIKQTPLYLELKKVFSEHRVELVSSGQHQELLDQALAHFSVVPTLNLNLMRPGQSLNSLSASVMDAFSNWLNSSRPDLVIVQGDTTTAAMVAIASFQCKIKVAHNEAGLRSFNLEHPFPEEANRKWISSVSSFNFAPTERAKQNLLAEGVNKDSIYVTGNTGIDALFWTINKPCPANIDKLIQDLSGRGLTPVLVTAHRRENAGDTMALWFETLKKFLDLNPRFSLVFNKHPNNLASDSYQKHLENHPRSIQVGAMDYLSTCHLITKSGFVVTDSGGIQEEAATLGVPAVVCRATTERPEGVDAGLVRLAGTNSDHILAAMNWAAERSIHHRKATLIYGDGKSSQKIAEIIRMNLL